MIDTKLGWEGVRVRNKSGATGRITGEFVGFLHVWLSLTTSDGEAAHIQLNSNGKDSGATGWEWLDEGSGTWYTLGLKE